MHAISLKCAISNVSTSVSVYFDSWALNRLFLSETSGHNDDLVIPCTLSVCIIPLWYIITYIYQKWCHSYQNAVHFKLHILQKKYQPSLQNVPLPDGFPSATTRAWPSTTNHEVPSILRVRTSEMTCLFPPGRQAQVQTSSLFRLQYQTVNCKKEPIYWVLRMFLWFPQFLLLSSLRHLATRAVICINLVESAVRSL